MKIFLLITVTILSGYAFSHIISERQAAVQRPILQKLRRKPHSSAIAQP